MSEQPPAADGASGPGSDPPPLPKASPITPNQAWYGLDPGGVRPPVRRPPIQPVQTGRLLVGLGIAAVVNLPVVLWLLATAASQPLRDRATTAVISGLVELPLLGLSLLWGGLLLRGGRGLGHGLLVGAAVCFVVWGGPCVALASSNN